MWPVGLQSCGKKPRGLQCKLVKFQMAISQKDLSHALIYLQAKAVELLAKKLSKDPQMSKDVLATRAWLPSEEPTKKKQKKDGGGSQTLMMGGRVLSLKDRLSSSKVETGSKEDLFLLEIEGAPKHCSHLLK